MSPPPGLDHFLHNKIRPEEDIGSVEILRSLRRKEKGTMARKGPGMDAEVVRQVA